MRPNRKAHSSASLSHRAGTTRTRIGTASASSGQRYAAKPRKRCGFEGCFRGAVGGETVGWVSTTMLGLLSELHVGELFLVPLLHAGEEYPHRAAFRCIVRT